MTSSLRRIREHDADAAKIIDDFFNLLKDVKEGKRGPVKEPGPFRAIWVSLLIVSISIAAWCFCRLDTVASKFKAKRK